jgi:hypothetical protein
MDMAFRNDFLSARLSAELANLHQAISLIDIRFSE